jgi:tetratricopeptide (TPR) repeat protein
VFDKLGESWFATVDELAQRTAKDPAIVASALAGWVQAGRAIYDLDRGVYRKRELTREPLPLEALRFANEREEAAARMLVQCKIAIDRADGSDGGLRLGGRIKYRERIFAPEITFDADRRLVAGECSCDFFIRNRLHKGPCEHMLALRAAHRRGRNDEITFEAPPGTRTAAPARNDREDFQTAFRRSVLRATELRSAGRHADSVAELERIARLAPPDSDEFARLQEVIAESKFDQQDHQAARAAADRALRKFPGSSLALRIKRDSLVALDDLPAAIPVARALAGAENTAARWDELVRLCHRVEDWAAMATFATEGLTHHPKSTSLANARDVAVQQGADATPTADQAPKPSWWRRAVSKITGKGGLAQKVANLDTQLGEIADEITASGATTDRRSLLYVMRIAHASAEDLDGKVRAMVDAIRASHARDLPDERTLHALVRDVLTS